MKSLTRIQVNFNHGQNSKHADYVVTFVIIFLGMATICMNIGGFKIERFETNS